MSQLGRNKRVGQFSILTNRGEESQLPARTAGRPSGAMTVTHNTNLVSTKMEVTFQAASKT